jgi:uncharacterized protein YndB with AHSA1/START domain
MQIDIAATLGAVTREVRFGDRDGQSVTVVVASRTYDTSVEDLWDALTNAERIPRWFLPVSGDLRLGGRYQLQGNAGGTITACEPPHRLTLTWEAGGKVGWVDLALAAEKTGARLTLEHAAPHPDDHWSKYGAGATGVGWDGAFMGLGLHLASGVANDPQAAMAWMTSNDGKSFYRASSEERRRAAVAGGEDEADAAARAAAPAAAYTGEGG